MQMLTAKDVANLLKLPLARVYELTRQHELPAVRLGRRQLRYSLQTLNDWIKRGGTGEDSGENPRGTV